MKTINRKAFTLIELLLVLAIVAIIVLAGIPYFTKAQNDAFEESKKGSFSSSYQNTVFGANLMMSILFNHYTNTSNQGSNRYKNMFLPENLSLDALNQWKFKEGSTEIIKNLNYYCPITSRVFTTKTGKQYFFSAKIGSDQTIVIYYVDPLVNGQNGSGNDDLAHYHGAADKAARLLQNQEIHIDKDHPLDWYWEQIKDN